MFPLKENFKRFFELPNIFTDMLNNLEKISNSSKIISICSGSVWKHKSSLFEDKVIIPYVLYQDDFEVNNALGSKSGVQKRSVFYVTFPLLNLNRVSQLNNILVACITKSISLEFGQSYNFGPLVSVLTDLETNGLDIQIGSTKKKYFLC